MPRIFSFALYLLALEAHGDWCFPKLKSAVEKPIKVEFLGEGNTARVELHEYADGRKEAVKTYHLGGYRQNEDLRSSKYLRRVLSGSSVKVAKYEKISNLNPLAPKQTRVEYFEGTDMNRLMTFSGNFNELSRVHNEYISAVRTTVEAILKDPALKSLSFSFKSSAKYTIKNGVDNPEARRVLELAIQSGEIMIDVKTRDSWQVQSLYIRPQNFLQTPAGEIVIIDPF